MKITDLVLIFGYSGLLEMVSNAPAAPNNASFNISRSTNEGDVEAMVPSNNSEYPLIKSRKLKCAFPSNIIGARSKRASFLGIKWSKSRISYSIYNYPTNSEMTPTEVESEIQRAFDTWSEHTNLVFFRTLYFGDIQIGFESDEHGDNQPFYLNSTVVAHATFKGYDDSIHFNDHKTWTIKSFEGENLFEIAVHEIGHNLGIDHSTCISSVMYKWTVPYNPNFKLSQDDIDSIQALYGPKQVTTTNLNEEGSGFGGYDGSGSGSGSGDGGNEESDNEGQKIETFCGDHGAENSGDHNDGDDYEGSELVVLSFVQKDNMQIVESSASSKDKEWYFEEESRQTMRLASLNGSNKFLPCNWGFAVLMLLGTILYRF